MSKASEDLSDIGQQFFYGRGRKRSYVKALPYLIQAATLDDPHCQNLVGYCYDLGLGTKKDLRQAILWYQRAALNDDIEALGNLALHYEKGEALERTCEKHSPFIKELLSLEMHGLSAILRLHISRAWGQSKIWLKASNGFREQRAKEMLKRNTTWVWPILMAKVCDKTFGMPNAG